MPWKWCREDYYKLGELGVFQGKRVELIRGEIVEMSPINWPHAYATGLVAQVLAKVFSSGFWLSIQQPFSVPGITTGSEPLPDVVCVPGTLRGRTGHPTTAALIVEVSDTTLFYDTTTKAQLYAEARIGDCWAVDITNQQLHIFRDPAPIPDGGQAYRTHITLGPPDTITPLAAPNAIISVSDLLP
jgi:Uma2 family endonuclease